MSPACGVDIAYQLPRISGVEYSFQVGITEEGNALNDQPDTPTSQSAAARWTFYRRLGLLMRTHLESDGTTLSLHEVASRTRGRVSADQLIAWLEQGARAQPDAVTCVVLAQAFGVDPDYFVDNVAVTDYIAGLRANYANCGADAGRVSKSRTGLQAQALAVTEAHDRHLLSASTR